jgi:hypothetical protein
MVTIHRANAFLYDGTFCEVGRISPLNGFLENQKPLRKGPRSGHMLIGCSVNCK